MTVDQRVIECAKAMADTGLAGNCSFPGDSAKLALACVLKWLEQEPSAAMAASTSSMAADYRAMCAVAKREVLGS